MLIEDYFQQVDQIIINCLILQSYTLTTDKRSFYRGFIRGKFIFIDGSILEIREFVDVKNGFNRDKYTYQYMNSKNELIFRYDDAPHHQKLNLPNYPHHKHDRSEDNIIDSSAPNLADVLAEIELYLNSN